MNKLIQDIGFVQHIQKPKNSKIIPVTINEELPTYNLLNNDLESYDMGFVNFVQCDVKARKIPVTVYEELNQIDYIDTRKIEDAYIKWINAVPYRITVI